MAVRSWVGADAAEHVTEMALLVLKKLIFLRLVKDARLFLLSGWLLGFWRNSE